jgi:hypothetical protein
MLDMAEAFGAPWFGAALVVISVSTDLSDKGHNGLVFDHCHGFEVDYQSGSKQPRSKGSAELRIGFKSIAPTSQEPQ